MKEKPLGLKWCFITHLGRLKEIWYNKNLWWNLFKFSWIVHYRKICKNQVQKQGAPCYFLSSRGQKIKNITKLSKRDFSVCILGCIFYGISRPKTELHTKYIWFNFVFGSVFAQDHLLNLIILGVYAIRLPK